MIEHYACVADLATSISSLKKRIENAQQENETLHKKIQESLHEKGGTALPAAIQACTKATIDAYKLQQRLAAAEKKVAVKEDILLPLKSRKCDWANDKNCERKNLLSILQIGLNVLEVGPEVAKIEFVVNSLRILTSYSCAEETFKLIALEPAVNPEVFQSMQKLLEETNDICGLLSAAKKSNRL